VGSQGLIGFPRAEIRHVRLRLRSLVEAVLDGDADLKLSKLHFSLIPAESIQPSIESTHQPSQTKSLQYFGEWLPLLHLATILSSRHFVSMKAHRNLSATADGFRQRSAKPIHLLAAPSSISMRFFHRIQRRTKVCSAYITCRLERLDLLTRLTEEPILIESDSESECESDSVDEPPPNQPRSTPPSSSPPPSHEQGHDEHSDDELPDIQDLLCSRSSREAYIVPALAASQRCCASELGDDVTPTAQRSEGDCTGGKGDQHNDNDTELEAQYSEKKRKCVRFLSVDTMIPALETLRPDVSSDLNDESPAKRQRLHRYTESVSTSPDTLAAIPVLLPMPTAIGDGSDNAGYDGEANGLEERYDSGNDAGEDALSSSSEPAEPSTRTPSTLQRNPSCQQERDDRHEPDESQNNVDNGRTINNDSGSQSLARTRTRQRTTKPPRRAIHASSPHQRSAAKMVNQQTQRSEAQSLSAETAASPLSHPTLSRTGKGAAQLGNNGGGMPIQHDSLKVDEIILRPASAGVLFLVATIRTTGDPFQLACLEPAELLESTLGNMGKVDSITVKPSAPAGSWHVIGLLHPLHPHKAYIDSSGSTVERGAMRAPGTLRDRARALCSDTVDATEANTDGDVIHCNRYNGIGSDDGGSEDGDDQYDDKNYELPVRASRRWDPLEEKRLQAWRTENKPWEWIFDQFPDRTEAAVRVRWYMLQRSTRNVQ